MNIKLGHQAPIGWRVNTCQYLTMDGQFEYNSKYNFVYDHKEESYKLHQGQACYFTDARFNAISNAGISSNFNFLSLYLKDKHKNKGLLKQTCYSHKSAIRKVLKCKGLPKGTLITFHKNWKYEGHRFLDNSFIFKVRKDNPINITYEITHPSFYANFTTYDKTQELVDILRNNGFLVSITTDSLNAFDGEYLEVATAYGQGKRVGISPIGMPIHGYYKGVDKVLWDTYENFGTWSRCNYIPMSLPTEDILSILLKNDEKDINWCTLT